MSEARLQASIKKSLESIGCLVQKIQPPPVGVPDLLVIYAPGQHFWIEVKTPTGKLSKPQRAFHHLLRSKHENVYTVEIPIKQSTLLTVSDLRDYQKQAIVTIIKQHKIALFMKPGMGKTVCVLYALARLNPKKTLLVAPIRVCETVWAQEAKHWDGLENLTFEIIRGTPQKRLELLGADAAIHLINYELLSWLKGQVDISKTYDAIVFDELSMMKSPGSGRFKAVKKHIDKIPIRIGLTGTPTGNSLLGIWSQLYCITGSHNPLGKSHYQFKEYFFRRGGYENRQFFPWPDTHTRILEQINGWAYSFELDKEYCPLNFSTLPVKLTPDIKPNYKKLTDDYILFLEDNLVSAPTGGALINKLRQYESGFLYGEEGTVTIHTQKIESTVELVEELNGDPLIIFYEFREELAGLLEKFPGSNNITVDQWNTGQHPVMLLHPKSAGHGLNLQKGGCNILFYTVPWSLELWQQSIGRLYRSGQQRAVTVYHFSGFPIENQVIRALKKHEQIEAKTFSGLTVEAAV